MRSAPPAGVRIREALEMVLTAAAFDQSVSLLFLDDGVNLLECGQASRTSDSSEAASMLDALELYDVNDVFVEQESLDDRGLSAQELRIPVRRVARSEIAALLADHDLLISG